MALALVLSRQRPPGPLAWRLEKHRSLVRWRCPQALDMLVLMEVFSYRRILFPFSHMWSLMGLDMSVVVHAAPVWDI